MKKIVIILINLIVILTVIGCSNNELENEIKEKEAIQKDLEKQIAQLEIELDKYKSELDRMKKENEVFEFLYTPSLEFVRAHTTGDTERLRTLVSEDVAIIEKDNKIYGIYKNKHGETEVPLYGSFNDIYKDMVIIGYGYSEYFNAYVVYIREFYIDESGNPSSPPTYLNLYFQKFGYDWKVVAFEFDV